METNPFSRADDSLHRAASTVPVPFFENPEHWESVFRSAPLGLCVVDLDFRYLAVNDAFSRMYGMPIDYFIGKTVHEALPDLATRIIDHLDRAIEAGGIVESEITLQHPGDPALDTPPRQLTYLRTAQPARDAAGTTVAISVALIDITSRKLAEAALRESEENLRYTVELTPHVPWTADPTGALTFMSPRWTQITGAKPTPALLKNWIIGVHQDDRPETLAAWNHSLDTGESYDRSYRVHCLGGVWRWHRARAYPRRDDAGNIVLWYGTVEDIHDRKLAEEALEVKTHRLELATEALDQLVRQDHLTGVANRRTFDETLSKEIERARRSRLPLALVMFDVDHFKRFNDTFGHTAGDEVLRHVAQALKSVIHRPADLAARFGGEEFVLVLPDTPEDGALQLARDANAAISRLEFRHAAESIQRITISAGVAMLEITPDADKDVLGQRLLDAADKALYEAKASGRDRVCVAPRQSQL